MSTINNAGVLVDLKIYNNGMTEVVTTENGVKKNKLAQLSELANMLSAFSSGYSPLLPEGTIKYGFKNGRIKILIAYDESMYSQDYSVNGGCSSIDMCDFENISTNYEYSSDDGYDDDDDDDRRDHYDFTVNTYLPKTLFLVDMHMSGGKYMLNTHGCRMFHYFDDLLLNDTKLYNFPFGNIYDNNELCFGDMPITDAKYNPDDFRGVNSILNNWKGATSNLDLYYRLKNNRSFDFIYEYCDGLKDINSISQLRGNSELYAKTRTSLENAMIETGITFGSFIIDKMK